MRRMMPESLEARTLLAAVPFNASQLTEQPMTFAEVAADTEFAQLATADGNWLQGYEIENGTLVPTDRIEFDAPIQELSRFGQQLLVTTEHEIWSIGDQDGEEQSSLLFSSETAIVDAAISSSFEFIYLDIATAETLTRYPLDAPFNEEPAVIAQGDVVGVAAAWRPPFGPPVTFALRTDDRIDIYLSNRDEAVASIADVPGLETEMELTSGFPQSQFRNDDVLVHSSLGDVILLETGPGYIDLASSVFAKSTRLFERRFADETEGRSWIANGDIDRNELFDLVVSETEYLENGSSRSVVSWYENRGDRFQRYVLAEGDASFGKALVTDLDQDGQVEAITLGDAGAWLFQFDAPRPIDDVAAFVATGIPKAEQAFFSSNNHVADLDSDGDPDIVSGGNSFTPLALYSNRGDGMFEYEELATRHERPSSSLWDYDNDGDLDIAVIDDGQFYVIPNLGNGGLTGRIRLGLSFTSPDARFVLGRSTGDFDNDDDVDLLLLREDNESWNMMHVENLGIAPNQRPRFALHALGPTIEDRAGARAVVMPFDMGQDADLDFLALYHACPLEGPKDVYLYLYENQGGGSFDPPRRLGRSPLTASLNTTMLDFDRDGDSDLITLGVSPVIYLNDGTGQFSAGEIPFVGTVNAVFDVDGDGDVDFVGSGDDRTEPAWYENLGNDHDFRRRQFKDGRFRRVTQVYGVADFDLDGRMDVLARTRVPELELQVFRNNVPHAADVTGDGRLDTSDVDQLCRAIAQGDEDALFDIDGDQQVGHSDLDLMLSRLGRVAGDINLDGQFDSSDLVQMMVHGHFDNGPSNAVAWSTGDWNCDGVVDSQDLMAMMQRGHYVRQ